MFPLATAILVFILSIPLTGALAFLLIELGLNTIVSLGLMGIIAIVGSYMISKTLNNDTQKRSPDLN